jgi:uncharacterized protein
MAKLLLILLLVIVVGCWIARLRAPTPPRDDGRPGSGPRERRSTAAGRPQEIVACAHCGLHLPRAEALEGPGGALYCSEAHRLGQGDRG